MFSFIDLTTPFQLSLSLSRSSLGEEQEKIVKLAGDSCDWPESGNWQSSKNSIRLTTFPPSCLLSAREFHCFSRSSQSSHFSTFHYRIEQHTASCATRPLQKPFPTHHTSRIENQLPFLSHYSTRRSCNLQQYSIITSEAFARNRWKRYFTHSQLSLLVWGKWEKKLQCEGMKKLTKLRVTIVFMKWSVVARGKSGEKTREKRQSNFKLMSTPGIQYYTTE